MAELFPIPFGRLVTRMFAELSRDRAVFDLGVEKFFRGDAARDLSVSFHGRRAATPLGPAAGPHSQLAQNVVLSFLGGARIMELKTVQIQDELRIPRPCIDVATVGYNVEWSQELKLEQSLEEYVKASMLLEILAESGVLGLAPGAARTIFDMSVGYDLAGIQSPRVRAFLRGMMDCTEVVDRLRREIPAEHARYRDLAFTTRLSDTLTLSTFHGCPPDEIERIIDHLLREHALHCVIKCNPTLLGPAEARRLFHDALGYRERIPDEAFEKDTRWEQAVAFVGRLRETANKLGLGLGVKLSNTLIVENHKDFFPKSERLMYLSGPPLHVLAMALVARFRETFGAGLPLSFSAGIDRSNFADGVALGLVPVTVCTDLLKPGGYGRLRYYFGDLGKRMVACGARDIDELTLLGHGQAEAALASLDGAPGCDEATLAACRRALAEKGDVRAAAGPELFARWLDEAKVRNTRHYLEKIVADPRYAAGANAKPPTKVGTRLWLFECLTCDKCIPVCPNDANFAYDMPKTEIPVVKLRPRGSGGGFDREEAAPLRIEKKHQIATYADLCNECGNCDVFCPEDGGPYILKPRFFGSEATFERFATHDGFFLGRGAGVDTVLGRFEGRAFRAEIEGERARFAGPGFDVELSASDPEATIAGRVDAEAVIDLTYFRIMDWLRRAVLDGPGVNYVNT
jgi:putative selenate reductase